jgi:hypothetical protein
VIHDNFPFPLDLSPDQQKIASRPVLFMEVNISCLFLFWGPFDTISGNLNRLITFDKLKYRIIIAEYISSRQNRVGLLAMNASLASRSTSPNR